jgi:16S rRNA (guanine966-N2)-methyltransferase
VIAGRLGGRRFAAPPGRDTRPTADRVREALFSALGPSLPGAVVLDLYAGSGALAIEALSRGAERAVLVEADRRAAAVVARNLADLGLEAEATLHRTTAERYCAAPGGGPFDLVLCDPPYATTLADVHARLTDLHAAGALATDATAVIERDKRDPDLDRLPPRFLAPARRRAYGDTVLLVHDRVADDPEARDQEAP